MIRLNLLPWREAARKQQDRQLIQHAGLAGFAVVVILLYFHMDMSAAIHRQEARNAYLQQAIAQMNVKIAKITRIKKARAALLARMKVIQQLQADRMQIVHTFNDLARTVPTGVYLMTLSQTHEAFVVTGVAQSNERVSQFMRNLANSPWFTNPILNVIHVVPSGSTHVSLFTLDMQGIDKAALVKAKKHPAGRR